MNQNTNSIYKENVFEVVFKISPTFSGVNKNDTRLRRHAQAQNTRGVHTIADKLGLGHQQPLPKRHMYASWIKICENHIFMSSKQFGSQRVIKKHMERVTSTGISGIPNKSGHCNQYAISMGSFATHRNIQ